MLNAGAVGTKAQKISTSSEKKHLLMQCFSFAILLNLPYLVTTLIAFSDRVQHNKVANNRKMYANEQGKLFGSGLT
jgi:hypothetical protein